MAHTPVHLTYTYEAVTLGKDGIAPIFQLPFKTAVKVLSSCENKKIFICSFFAKNGYNLYSTGWTEWA